MTQTGFLEIVLIMLYQVSLLIGCFEFPHKTINNKYFADWIPRISILSWKWTPRCQLQAASRSKSNAIVLPLTGVVNWKIQIQKSEAKVYCLNKNRKKMKMRKQFAESAASRSMRPVQIASFQETTALQSWENARTVSTCTVLWNGLKPRRNTRETIENNSVQCAVRIGNSKVMNKLRKNSKVSIRKIESMKPSPCLLVKVLTASIQGSLLVFDFDSWQDSNPLVEWVLYYMMLAKCCL